MMPGRISGSVTVRKTQAGFAPSVLAASSSRLSTASIDSRIARTISGKAHDRAGQRGTRPAEREDDAEMLIEEGADRPFPAEGDEQQIAGDDRRHHQRQMHDAVEQRLAPEVAPREQPGDGQAEGKAADHGHGRNQEAKPDRGQLVAAQRPPAQCHAPQFWTIALGKHPSPLPLSRKGRGEAALSTRGAVIRASLLPLREKDRMRGRPRAARAGI